MATAPAKPRRKPPAFDPLSPAAVRVTIVQKLVSPAALKQKGAWGRELAILKRLQKLYNSDDFWLTLAPALSLESLLWFCGEFGAAALREQWQMHLFGRAQDQNALDSASSTAMMESTAQETEPLPALKPKKSAIGWADGED